MAPTKQIGTVVSAQGTKRLTDYATGSTDYATGSHATLDFLLIAAFARTLMACAGAEEIYTNVTAANRTVPALANFVGWHSRVVPFRCSMNGGRSLGELAKELHEQARRTHGHVLCSSTIVGSEFDNLVNENGGFMRQFKSGPELPETILRKTTVSSGFMAEDGEVIRSGSISSQRLRLRNPGHLASEMSFRNILRKDKLELHLAFDKFAFTASEAEDILRETIQRLALKADEIGKIQSKD